MIDFTMGGPNVKPLKDAEAQMRLAAARAHLVRAAASLEGHPAGPVLQAPQPQSERSNGNTSPEG